MMYRPNRSFRPLVKLLLLATALATAWLAAPAHAQINTNKFPPPTHPNIIFILAVDLGYGELGCYGQTEIQTPNIDKLAQEGMRFTSFYAGSTVCAPSRTALHARQTHRPCLHSREQRHPRRFLASAR